jgi:conjugative relaxase-like TrwC/TraI family protein
VLSIGKIGVGNGDPSYYLDAVSSGQEDYYTGSGEAPGTWVGRGAAARGLEGRVEDDTFLRLLDPTDGNNNKSVLAYDLTFSAPKSVSILYGVADDETSRNARAAHDAAVRDALGYLEREACWTRRGRNGVHLIKGDGLTIAAFRHRSSRAGDPQLHTHAVVVNATTAGGRTTTLDGRALYAHAKTASYLYQASLRHQLAARLGVEWSPVDKGIAEIKGIDEPVRRHFSRRRAEILASMRDRGGRSAHAAQIATLETRRAKDYNVPVARLRDEWRARAAELGLDRERIAGIFGHGRPQPPLDIRPTAESLAGPDGLTEQLSAFDRRDVIRAWAEAHRAGARVSEVEQHADDWLERADVVRLDSGRGRQQLGGARYSTEDLLRIETALMRSAAERRITGVAQVRPEIVEARLPAAQLRSEEQEALVQTITTSGHGVEVVRSPAGAGKTRALAAARDIWEAEGIRVYGCAVAARAAAELEQTAGIDSSTVASLLIDLDRGYGLAAGSVLIVDEAGTAGTRTIARLAEHAQASEAKLLLVGDDHQLPEIEAGGAFRALGDELGTVELQEVQRQKHAWDRQALGHLRSGDIDTWAAAYAERGRLVVRPTATAVRAALVDDWWAAASSGQNDSVMIAHRRCDVAELNEAARDRMRREGRLGAELEASGRSYAIGDRVIARRNDRRREIVNGTRGVVTNVDAGSRRLTLRTAHGEDRDLDSTYLDAGWLDHAYALTAHAAQGATVDRSFVLGGDDLYREWGYTAMTRHREAATFYLVSPGSVERVLPGLKDDRQVLDDLRRSLATTRRKSMANSIAADDRATRDARERIDRLARECEQLRFWERGRRSELDSLMSDQQQAIERLRRARPEVNEAMDRVSVDQPPLVEGNQLRAQLVTPSENVREALGARPSAIADRDRWMRAAAQLIHGDEFSLDQPLEAPTMDYDSGFEL